MILFPLFAAKIGIFGETTKDYANFLSVCLSMSKSDAGYVSSLSEGDEFVLLFHVDFVGGEDGGAGSPVAQALVQGASSHNRQRLASS